MRPALCSCGLATLLLTAAPGVGQAQDALRGKRLYLDAARAVQSGVSCVDCHGGLPGGLFGIGRAANQPERIALAIDSVPPMAPFRGRFTAVDLSDLAAYLGDPLVPSPQVTVTTTRGDGSPGPADRVDFGTVMAGATSDELGVALRNTGQLDLTITAAPELLGDDAGELWLTRVECAAGRRLAPQQACHLALRFAPTGADGPRAARLRISHDWVSGAAALAVLGRVGDPAQPEDPPEPMEPSGPRAASSGCRVSGETTGEAERGAGAGLAGFAALGALAALRRRGAARR